MRDDVAPGITGIHHFSVTVCDLEASLNWYQRVFRADRVPMTFPHYEREDTGYGVLLVADCVAGHDLELDELSERRIAAELAGQLHPFEHPARVPVLGQEVAVDLRLLARVAAP